MTEIERRSALCGVTARRSLEAKRSEKRERFWRGAFAVAALLVVAALVVGIRFGLELGTPETVAPNISTMGGVTLCDKYWQATGDPCSGGCWYEKDCYVCTDDGCTYSHTVRACFPSSEGACPLGGEVPDHLFVDANGNPIEPSDEYVKSPAPRSPF